MNDDYRQGQLDLIDELVGYVRDEHDHFLSYIDSSQWEGLDDERDVLVPGACLRLATGAPVRQLGEPFVDSLAMEGMLLRRREELAAAE